MGDCRSSFRYCSGFSLIEILVSLFIVCIVAVNISGLQKMIGDQSRDNISHLTVVKLVAKNFEQIKQNKEIQDIVNLNGSTSSYSQAGTTFLLKWDVGLVSGASITSSIRDVHIEVTWPDAKGEIQTFVYSELISLMMLLKGVGDDEGGGFSYQIPNLLNTNEIGYFDSKMEYKIDAYVIYNSQLFQATEGHNSIADQQNNLVAPMSLDGIVSDGWLHLGQIDDPQLATLFVK
ncbi:prepilin-type N-terminal cleavage/methylation domain-containing protein [Psychromonas sp. KJ10-10]|uniref:type IV pilus modification PilV family protein n=1 Tax=Psychromonas sp. KJ10-10 TaxID=3391823 RepID=UPI0039B6A58E